MWKFKLGVLGFVLGLFIAAVQGREALIGLVFHNDGWGLFALFGVDRAVCPVCVALLPECF